jgi:hypothetical protein
LSAYDAEFFVPASPLDGAELPAVYHRVTERIAALPDVTRASLSANGPFSGSRTTSGFEVQGYAHGRE